MELKRNGGEVLRELWELLRGEMLQEIGTVKDLEASRSFVALEGEKISKENTFKELN